jgi:hypothetical protein
MDCAIDSVSAAEGFVGRGHDRIHSERRNVASDETHPVQW